MEYLHVTLSSEVLSVNSSGTDVVLAQFPVEGETLTSFGLTPSIIKTIAIPNDLQEWPTTALNGCTNLEKITVHGPESFDGSIGLSLAHNLQNLTSLVSIQLPSTVTDIFSGGWNGMNTMTTFPKSIQSITLSAGLKTIGRNAFVNHANLYYVDFSVCKNLKIIDGNNLFYSYNITSLDFSNCPSLRVLGFAAFSETSLSVLILPPSIGELQSYLACEAASPRDLLPTFKTLIWTGRSERLPVNGGMSSDSFGYSYPLATLVENKVITEIFIP